MTYARKMADKCIDAWAASYDEPMRDHLDALVRQVIEDCAVAARTDIHYEEDAVNEAIGRIRDLATRDEP